MRIYTKLIMIMHLTNKLYHIRKYNCQEYNVPTPQHPQNTWTSIGKAYYYIDHVPTDRRQHSNIVDVLSFGELTVILIIIWLLQKLDRIC